ncbi:MAG: calcium/sodium antiporter [Desulfobacterales bacterium]|nr:calcium/sodium antiporter [Desulfobacterales bacterium]
MLIDIFLLVFGLALLLGGGDILVRGASAFARSLGVSSLIIGLTVVAFGTSAPELAVNLHAAVEGNSEIAFGNIMGSNIANIGLILGIAALLRPLAIEGTIISREIPMMILASVLALIAGSDMVLRVSGNVYDRSDGLVFLLLFCIFIYYTTSDVVRERNIDPLLKQAESLPVKKSLKPVGFNIFLVGVGLACLFAGGKFSVNAAVSIAEALNIPRVIIGLTIIAVGTSLPELVTSLIATWKGQTDLAIGNVVGSNIFNLLFINGLSATLRPIPVPSAGGLSDLYMMVFLALLLFPLCITHKKKLVRWEGVLLIAIYFGYNFWRIFLN